MKGYFIAINAQLSVSNQSSQFPHFQVLCKGVLRRL
jgi:hypothetical protein